MKPPFAYFGGKTRMAERIAALLPEHGHYVEPFAGSLAVLLAKAPSAMETVNDLEGDLMNFWRVLRDRTEELVVAAALTPHSRAEHQAAYEPCDDELEQARRTWVLLSQGRSGTLHRTGWRYFSNPGGNGYRMASYLDAYVERMPPGAVRLRSVSLECRPALDIIADYGQHEGVCFYVDPPYEGSTRPGSPTGYRHEMLTAAEHEELLTALLGCKGAVVISGYHSDTYDRMLDGWDQVEFSTITTQGTGPSANRTEVLWSNRPLHAGRLDLFGRGMSA